jgi:ATP-dependent exoDNAse (exonuclease V) alpha subunit
MVAALTTAAGLAVVVGPAGAGKTAALAAAGQAWKTAGRSVVGAALAAVTARRLEHATGVPSMSLARLLAAANATDPDTGRPAGLPHRGVLVVDEASMVDTRTLAALLAHTKEAAGTLVLVGDPAQLPEIGAGGLFAALARHRDTIVLTDNRRQTEPWERRALADLRTGDSNAALAAYAAHQRLHTAPSGELAERIVTDYLRHRTAADRPDQVVMLAVRRADVAQLNTAARKRLIAAGQLGDAVVVGSGDRQREYRRGDQVIVTTNDHRRRLLNGTRATLTHVDPRQRTLILATDDHRQITVPAGWAVGRLDHGYALTCHKAQGATVDTALLYGTGTLGREASYVGLSRGRRANHLYVPDDLALTEPEDSRLLDLAAELAASRAQTMATRQLPHARAMVGHRHRPLPPEQHGVHVRSEGIWL